MKMKKILSLILSVIMVISMTVFAAPEIISTEYAVAANTLTALDILEGDENGKLNLENDITRAEMTAIIIRSLGLENAATSTMNIFTDVPTSHWANGVITLAAQKNIVNGYGDGTFGPEDPVTYEQAVKMVVAALGYTIVAESNGGYPGGFQIVAAQAGILDGITNGVAAKPAKRGVVAQLIYNALEVPMLSQVGFGDEVRYDYDNVLLLDKLNVAKVRGTINSIEPDNKVDVTLTSQLAAKKGESESKWYSLSEADRDIYNEVKNTIKPIRPMYNITVDVSDYVGYTFNFYMVNPTAKNATIIGFEPTDSDYNEVIFASEDYYADKSDLANGRLAIYTDNDYEIYRISTTPILYENNKIINMNVEDYLALEGNIKMLDANDDDIYDTMYITTYIDIVVDSISKRSYRIIGTNAERLILDVENEDYTFEIIKNDKVVDFDTIAKNDVLSVAGEIVNNELVNGKVIVNTKKVSGTINGLDSENNIVYIDGVEYTYKAGVITVENLGDIADFYINARGIICGLDETTRLTNLKYGFVTIAMETTGLTSDTMELRMMDTKGVWDTYVLNKDFDVTAFKALGDNSVDNDEYIYNKVVAYELDKNGKIKEMYIDNTEDIFEYTMNTTAYQYNANTEIYNNNIITNNTVIFNVPAVPSTTEPIDEDDVTIATIDMLVDREYYTMTAFNKDDDGIVPILLGYGITGRIDYSDDFMIVSNISKRTNSEGEIGTVYAGLINGEDAKVFVPETIMVTDIVVGDVILYSVDAKGEATQVVEIARNIDDTIDVAGTTYTFYSGTVTEVKNGRITINDKVFTIKSTSIITEVDNTGAGLKVRPGDISSFEPQEDDIAGDTVIIKAVNDVVVVEAVVYKAN